MKMRAKNIISLLSFFFVYTMATGQIKPGSTCIPEPDTLDGQNVFRIVEKMPEYPGGTEKLYKYIGQHIRIAHEEKKIMIELSMLCTFIIDTTGQIRNECIIKSMNSIAMQAEMLEVIKGLGVWIPGEQGGRKVPVRLTIPIRLKFS